MIFTTKAQRQALLLVYRRVVDAAMPKPVPGKATVFYVPSYREFRRTVQPGPDCIMVRYAGMWLGIETDGYTHS